MLAVSLSCFKSRKTGKYFVYDMGDLRATFDWANHWKSGLPFLVPSFDLNLKNFFFFDHKHHEVEVCNYTLKTENYDKEFRRHNEF